MGSAEERARAVSILAREWQAIFDAIRDGVALLDAGGRVQRLNRSYAQILDRPVEELIGTSCYEVWGDIPEEKRPFVRALESRGRESIELEIDGRRFTITVDPIFDDSGRPAGAVQIISDVTDQRRLEAQFREGQKFETIGTLAAGVAHDFNNLLTSIMGNASLIASDLGRDSEHHGKLQDILRAAQRAADLTRQLLAYSGRGTSFMQRVDLSALVRQIQNLIEASIPKKIELELALAPNPARIDADPNQIQQIVLNLVSNAAEAIGENSGKISIQTRMEGADRVFLEVSDTGCGMDAETRTRIFDPFFTTKFTGRGLGLAAVAGIVRAHKASIDVTSSPGAGSAFRICFAAAEPAPHAALRKPPQKARTVLVVDDEEMVRSVARATLEIRGYKVVLANNGSEAIHRVRQDRDIALVLLDLTMPVMGGAEAIDHILEAHPEVKVIVSTGYDYREAQERFRRKNIAGFLQKPYTSQQLADKIESVAGR